MSKTIDFYFDFSSLYSYTGHLRIEEIANKYDYSVNWIPFSLGVVFKKMNISMPVQAKMNYVMKDLPRYAREYNRNFTFPKNFPYNSIPAARVMLWIKQSDPAQAIAFSQAVFAAAFESGRDCSQQDVLADLAKPLAIDSDALRAALADDQIKALLKQTTDQAIAQGLFGAPAFIVDGEMFWGSDRIDQMDRWLAKGGW